MLNNIKISKNMQETILNHEKHKVFSKLIKSIESGSNGFSMNLIESDILSDLYNIITLGRNLSDHFGVKVSIFTTKDNICELFLSEEEK